MKIIIFTDTHFANNHQEHNYKLKQFFKFLGDYAINHDIKTAIFCGDAFENKKMINMEAFDSCYSSFLSISCDPYNLDIYAIGGNHDTIVVNENTYSLKPFKTIMNVFLKPKTIMLEESFLFLPFGYELNDYYKKQRYVVCHQEINGAKYGSFKVCEKGINTSKYNSTFICGHLHQRQELDNYIIVGSPIYKQFGENHNIEKGFYVLDTEKNSFEFIKYDSPKYITLYASNDKEYLIAKQLIENDTYNNYRLELKFNKIIDINSDVDIKYNIKNEDQNFDLKLSTDYHSTVFDYINSSQNIGDLDKNKLKKIVAKYLKEI